MASSAPPITAEFVRDIVRNTKIGDEVRWNNSDAMEPKFPTRYISGKVLEKYPWICVTDNGHVRWNDIALYQYKAMWRGL